MIAILLMIILSGTAYGANYDVPLTTYTVDGDTYCGGSACTGSDTITVLSGQRKGILFKDFDGSGTYIKIANESNASDAQVDFDQGYQVGRGYVFEYHALILKFLKALNWLHDQVRARFGQE